MNLGAPEILVILVLALLVFGPTKLPEVGRQVGGALREFRKVQDSVRSEIRSVIDETNPTTVLRSQPEARPTRTTPAVLPKGSGTDMTDPTDPAVGRAADPGPAADVAAADYSATDYSADDDARDLARDELGLPSTDAGPPASGSFS